MHLLDGSGRWHLTDHQGHDLPATVPGSAVGALIAAGILADPLVGRQEAAATWVDERPWSWHRQLDLPAELLAEERIDLVADGLDVLTQVHLGGHRVGATTNRFRTYQWEVGKLLRDGARELRIDGAPAVPELRRRRGERDLYGVPSPIESLPTGWLRTAACQFGWDWGPRVAGCALRGAIGLRGWSTGRLADLAITQVHADGTVTLELAIAVRRTRPDPFQVEIIVSLAGRTVARLDTAISGDAVFAALPIPDPQRWWPNGLGQQPLYQVEVILRHDGRELDRTLRRIGLRTVTLVRADDAIGQSFGFTVNGVAIVAKGANWIPPHPIPERSDPALRERLFAAMTAAHFTMLRIWGGGIYEDDAFYARCDELGILVWQDLMMACAHVPLHDEAWVDDLLHEVRDQVSRLRHHPCLALWCGNNEFEMGGVSWTANGGCMQWDDYQRLFDRRLPELIATLDPTRAWWPCSPHTPQGDRRDDADPRCGDSHQWGVWARNQPLESVAATCPRFVSEFGFQSLPELKTLLSVMPRDEIALGHPGLEHRQRAGGGATQRLLTELARWLPVPDDLERLIRATQWLQGHYLGTAIRAWRREPSRCRGQLYWQLNDTWVGATWSTVDHLGAWKLSHAMVARAFAPVLLCVKAQPHTGQAIWSVTSDLPGSWRGRLEWQVTTARDGTTLRSGSVAVAMQGPGTLDIYTTTVTDLRRSHGDANLLIVGDLIQEHGPTTSHHATFVPPRDLQWGDPELTLTHDADGRIQVSARRPAFGVYVEADGTAVPDRGQGRLLMPGAPWMLDSASPVANHVEAHALRAG